MKKPAAARKKSVGNKYLRKAQNKGRDFQPSPTVNSGQTVTIKRTRFSQQRGI